LEKIREFRFYKERFLSFYFEQSPKVQTKIDYILDYIRFEREVPQKFFKKIVSSNGIYEVSVLTSEKSIRILCFKEKEELIVLTNCFVKKSQKTPLKEIRLAEKLKKDYSHGNN
jgi:phage-related protein